MDEYLLKAKLDDAIRLSYKETKFLGFLDPAETQFLKNQIKYRNDANFLFWGGFDDCERNILAVSQYEISHEDFPITAITMKFKEEYELSHRDFLGSFMALGVNRMSIGDILVGSGVAVLFCKTELLDYFVNSVSKIAKVGVKVSVGADEPLPSAHKFVDMNGVVASERADCILAFLLKTSREKASLCIKSGIVMCNYVQLASVSQKLNEKDKISVRGKGKFLIEQLGPLTKKDRMIIKCKKYV